jgi:hypothetical protein
MKYLTLGLLLAATLFSSCEKEEVKIPTCEDCSFTCLDGSETDVITNGCMNNWDCSYTINSQAKVDIDSYDGLASGGKNVFQMLLSTEGAMEIADDELEIIMVFELDESQNSFALEGSELAAINLQYRRVCFCTETSFKAVELGCMQGEKQPNGSWFVQGDLIVPYSFEDVEVKFEAQFEEI